MSVLYQLLGGEDEASDRGLRPTALTRGDV
jgi:hypothetical protein